MAQSRKNVAKSKKANNSKKTKSQRSKLSESSKNIKKMIEEELKKQLSLEELKKAPKKIKNKKYQVEEYIKENPWSAMGIIFAIGYLIGRMKK